jgi:hypothetical protein
MIRRFILLCLILSSSLSFAQEKNQVDSVAIKLLDRMSGLISELNAVSFDLDTHIDHLNDYNEFERHFAHHQIHMKGPDKMAVHSRGKKGNSMVYYDGNYFNYYSLTERNYVTLEAPDDILTMVDSMNTTFGIEFPAIDVFYPTIVEDVLDNFELVKYLGTQVIDGTECFHLMAVSDTMSFQLWIENNIWFLPKRYLIVDKKNNYHQYQATFNNWNINPDLPDVVFEFAPPRDAKLISIMAKN